MQNFLPKRESDGSLYDEFGDVGDEHYLYRPCGDSEKAQMVSGRILEVGDLDFKVCFTPRRTFKNLDVKDSSYGVLLL